MNTIIMLFQPQAGVFATQGLSVSCYDTLEREAPALAH